MTINKKQVVEYHLALSDSDVNTLCNANGILYNIRKMCGSENLADVIHPYLSSATFARLYNNEELNKFFDLIDDFITNLIDNTEVDEEHENL